MTLDSADSCVFCKHVVGGDVCDDTFPLCQVCRLVGDGVIAVVGTSHPSTFNTIQSYSHALHVPVILASSTRVTSPDRYLYDVSTSPPFIEAVMRVIAGLPRNHTLYYVYDTDDGEPDRSPTRHLKMHKAFLLQYLKLTILVNNSC